MKCHVNSLQQSSEFAAEKPKQRFVHFPNRSPSLLLPLICECFTYPFNFVHPFAARFCATTEVVFFFHPKSLKCSLKDSSYRDPGGTFLDLFVFTLPALPCFSMAFCGDLSPHCALATPAGSVTSR